MVLDVPLYRLKCGANSYDWGKVGSSSAAARFASATDFSIDEAKPYAELWMGTHPSNPSVLHHPSASGHPLSALLETNQALLGSRVAETYATLPFLFKVLSIRKALSIQAHPDKKLAEQLHARDPKNYPDANHKPEMAIAVTPFDGFCGFRPLAQVRQFLERVPSFARLVGDDAARAFIAAVSGNEDSADAATVEQNKAALKALYHAIMTAPESRLAACADELIATATDSPSTIPDNVAPLVLRLHEQFPGDIGLFCAFVLNHVSLSPGEALFLRANEPHAYLSGDIMECMAASDNVVRAGFTPKFKDVPVLVDMLTYSYAPIEAQKMRPEKYRDTNHTLLYDPPIDEFAVLRTALRPGEKETVPPVDGPSIVIATTGRGSIAVGPKTERLESGWVYFVGATAEVQLCADEELGAGDDEFVVFRAFCEVK